MSTFALKSSTFLLKRTKYKLFSFLLFSAILSPLIKLIPGFPFFRLHEIFIYGIFPFLILIGYFSFNNIYRLKRYHIILILIMFSYITSMGYAYLFLQINYSLRDFFDILKLFKWMLILFLATEIDFDENTLKAILITLVIAYLIILLFSIFQFFDLFNVTNTFSKYFTDEEHILQVLSPNRRVTAVCYNPNELAALCAIGNLLFLSLLFYYKKRYTPLLIIGYFSTLLTIILTSSRTGFTSLIFITIVFLLFIDTKMIYRIIFAMIIIIIIYLILPYLVYLNQLSEGTEILESNSLLGRFRMWQAAMIDIKKSPIFGNGIAKETMSTWIDSGILLYFRRVGIFGMIFWILYYIYPLFSIRKNHFISWFLITTIAFCLLYNITNNHYSSIKLSDTYIFLIGMSLSILNSNKNKEFQNK